MQLGEEMQIDIDSSTLQLAMSALQACANDEQEPERYRKWYQDAYEELRKEHDAWLN